ncbi:MAG: hypothetical protein Q7T18_12145 [Sedimentisphaerales bacterium]|nr:hypothetical protein [Sedimentisphaerales bacterium]
MEQKQELPVRQCDEATIQLLAQLHEKLYCGNMSRARRAAHNLSWMQDAGFDILKDGLLGNSSIGTKISAAYGLRCMRGRMKKMALEVLLQGLQSANDNTRRVCAKTAILLTKKTKTKPASGSPRSSIKEVPAQGNRPAPTMNPALQKRPADCMQP